MFKNFFRIDKTYWLLVPAILQATVPWFAFRVKILVVFVFVLVWLFLHFNEMFSTLSLKYSHTFMVALCWFLVTNFLNNIYAIFGHGDFSEYGGITMYLSQMVYFAVAHMTIVRRRFRELRFLVLVALLGIIIAGIMAMRGIGIEGLEGARSLVGTEMRNLSAEALNTIGDIVNIGLGDYRYVYMCAWLFPLMLVAFTLAGKWSLKVLSLVVAGACLVSIKMSGLGTPFFIMLLSTIIFFAWRISRSRRIVRVAGYTLIVGITFYFVAPVVYSPFSGCLNYIAENMSEGSARDRVKLVADSFSGDENYARDRARLQLLSWKTFCKNPVFGEGMYAFDFRKGKKNNTGGHSYVLDRLATSGILGFLPFVFFLWYLHKYYLELSRTYFGREWVVMPSIFVPVYLFSSIANPTFGVPHMIYIIIPGLALLIAMSKGDSLCVLAEGGFSRPAPFFGYPSHGGIVWS